MNVKDVVQLQLDYAMWASARLVAALGELSEEELNRDFGTADRSVMGTLVHVFTADRIWLRRVTGADQQPAIEDKDRTLRALREEWPLVLYDWKLWATKRTEEELSADLKYRDLAGREWTTPLWQVVLHVVNHGTHHRGQVVGFLRAMGKTPPPLDLVRMLRGL